MDEHIKKLKHTIEVSTSPWHAAKEAISQLDASGYTGLSWDCEWDLRVGGKYYVCPYGTSVFAFRIGENFSGVPSFTLASAHIDTPGLRIKQNAAITTSAGTRLNAEVYGGAIYHTWFDRPLSIAGRVALKTSDAFHPHMELIDFRRPVVELPNLAFHLNRSVNEQNPLNAQIDMLPLCGTSPKEESDYLLSRIASELNENPDNILCYELCVYNTENLTCTGFSNDMFMAPRIDNLSSVQACLTGLAESSSSDGIQLIALFDHEEIGSRSKNGAQGSLLPFTMERICNSLDISRNAYMTNMTHNYYLSLDVAHALHPNHPEKSDLTTALPLNTGFAVKCSSKQVYCSDSEMAGIVLQLAQSNDIPCRLNYMRSDSVGGGTVGPIVSSAIPMHSADIGIPVYAMHSAMETAGTLDQYHLEKFMKAYFSIFLPLKV